MFCRVWDQIVDTSGGNELRPGLGFSVRSWDGLDAQLENLDEVFKVRSPATVHIQDMLESSALLEEEELEVAGREGVCSALPKHP